MRKPAYLPFDQRQHLGEPPWSGPSLERWEWAHGHDARTKCYPEYGCQAILAESDWLKERLAQVEDERDALRAALREMVDEADEDDAHHLAERFRSRLERIPS